MIHRRTLALVIAILLSIPVSANDHDLPLPWGNLDWSSDGQYIAVATTKGLHIHNSDDLSLYKVLTEFDYSAIKWSNHGLRLAVSSVESWGITIWDLESEVKTYLTLSDEKDKAFNHIEWAHGDRTIAASSEAGIFLGNVEKQEIQKLVSFRNMYYLGRSWMHWRPPLEVDILSPMVNGIAIYNWYTGWLVDFIWNASNNDPARWSPSGNMIAAGDGPVTVWKVLPDSPVNAWAEIGGYTIHKLEIERARFHGLSWHPDSTKLAFVFSQAEAEYPPVRDFSRDGALIWDLSTGTTRLIPGVILLVDTLRVGKIIEWSPDGSKLAALSGDGRIVIWETDTYQVNAEYDGYLSLLD